MRYPEIWLVPLLMLADWYLTILGAQKAGEKYHQHFKRVHYELNPLWQSAVRQRRWFNPRHLLAVVFVTFALIGLDALSYTVEPLVQVMLGAVLTILGTIVATHISNLLLFQYFAANPEEVAGEVRMAHLLVLRMSQLHLLVVLLPLLMLSLITRNAYLVGGSIGLAGLVVMHEIWRMRARRSGANTATAMLASAEEVKGHSDEL